jgi:hypothetical protein
MANNMNVIRTLFVASIVAMSLSARFAIAENPAPPGTGPARVSYEKIQGGSLNVTQRQAPDHSRDFVDYELLVNGRSLQLLDSFQGALEGPRLVVDGVLLKKFEVGYVGFNSVFNKGGFTAVFMWDNTNGTSCPMRYLLIDLTAQRPSITKPFGSCGYISKVERLPDGLRVITPYGPNSAYPHGLEVSEIQGGHVKTCTTRSKHLCIPTSEPLP